MHPPPRLPAALYHTASHVWNVFRSAVSQCCLVTKMLFLTIFFEEEDTFSVENVNSKNIQYISEDEDVIVRSGRHFFSGKIIGRSGTVLFYVPVFFMHGSYTGILLFCDTPCTVRRVSVKLSCPAVTGNAIHCCKRYCNVQQVSLLVKTGEACTEVCTISCVFKH
jgi:hypothetical protein